MASLNSVASLNEDGPRVFFSTIVQSYQLTYSIQSTEVTIRTDEHSFSAMYILLWKTTTT